jgi:hypothetical protein
MRTEPAADEVITSGDGFEYHVFTPRAVPAGQPFSLHAAYTMDSARLSAQSIPSPGAGAPSAAQAGGPDAGSGVNWALAAMVAGGVLFIGALIWQIAARRRPPRVVQMTGPRSGGKADAGVNFCGNCGEPAGEGDRFCRGCGSKL